MALSGQSDSMRVLVAGASGFVGSALCPALVDYRGVNKNHAGLQTRTAALNLRRLLNLGPIRTEGIWMVTC